MRRKISTLLTLILTGIFIVTTEMPAATRQSNRVTVRIERFPRPPYSGATYYIYERGGEVICTKLEVCNKYDDCDVQYKKGIFKEDEDVQTGEPYGTEPAVLIPAAKLRKHVCLTKFKLVK